MNQYKVVVGSNSKDLSIEVTQALRDGWDLYGSMLIDGDGLMYQAMTK